MSVSESIDRPGELTVIHEILRVGEYTIRRFGDTEDYWIQHDSGEGMQTGKATLEALIHEYFTREF